MMFSFLTRQNEDRRVADTLSTLTQISEKVEFLSTQILKSIGTEEAKIMGELYDLIVGSEWFRSLVFFKLKPTPTDILGNDTFRDCAKHLGRELVVINGSDYIHSGDREIDRGRFEGDSSEYITIRKEMLKILSKYNVSLEDFLNR